MSTVTFQSAMVTVADLQCATVLPALTSAMNWSGYTASSCSTNPVATGTSVTFTNQYGTPYSQPITAVTSATTTPSTPAASCPADTPFDYAYASGIWALAFTSVITLHVVSLHIGAILNLIRGR